MRGGNPSHYTFYAGTSEEEEIRPCQQECRGQKSIFFKEQVRWYFAPVSEFQLFLKFLRE